MKRDMDLVRKILLKIEEHEHGYAPNDIVIEGFTQEQVGYHIMLMAQAQLVEGTDVTPMGSSSPEWKATHLIWAGHEFLDAAREPGRWEKAKAIAAKAGGVPLEVMKTILTTLGTQYVQGLLGVNGSTA